MVAETHGADTKNLEWIVDFVFYFNLRCFVADETEESPSTNDEISPEESSKQHGSDSGLFH